MITAEIEHKGKKYKLSEPTIESWADVMKLKDILSEEEMYIRMIEKATGLSHEEVMKTDAGTINMVGNQLFRWLNKESRELIQEFEHKGIKYKIVDVHNISFGQFVDIDTFLKKDEAYRIANLNELAAYLYIEDGIDYSDSNFKKRIEAFKDLPIKYVEGALFFLSNLEKGLREIMALYSKSKLMWTIMNLRIILASFGDTITQYLSSPKTKFGKLMRLLVFLLFLPLIISLTLLTLITKGIKSLVSKVKKLFYK
jgi:hypothetical protein